MDTLDRIVSKLKQNPEFLEPLDVLLEAACQPDTDSYFRDAETRFVELSRQFSCALAPQMLAQWDLPAPDELVHDGQRFERHRRSLKT